MKKYIEPKIKSVLLDPDQAILEICMIDGMWFAATTQCLAFGATTSIGRPRNCVNTVRGVGAGMSDFAQITGMPS
ncbi:MAG: hypothetical protein PHQ52_03490 [Candidatus Omnitrophica bacterium]|nr:hypothetical protein [Candidatus Omnitrophota bacterium]